MVENAMEDTVQRDLRVTDRVTYARCTLPAIVRELSVNHLPNATGLFVMELGNGS